MTIRPAGEPHSACSHAQVHLHGTRACAVAHGCPCQSCQAAVRRYGAKRGLLIAEGRWHPHVDAAPVREHVRTLRDAGMTVEQIARAASRPRPGEEQALVTVAALERLLYGRRRDGKTTAARRVRASSARALLAVAPEDSPVAVAARMEMAVGSLLSQGWAPERVGQLLVGSAPATVAAVARSDVGSRVLADQAAPVVRAALERHAARSGDPLTGTLSPNAVAVVRRVLCSVLPGAASADVRGAAVGVLSLSGLTTPQVAQVLGVSRRTVERHAAARARVVAPHI